MGYAMANALRTERPVSSELQLGELSVGILLVEDEPLVREVTAEVLRSAGYVVWKARNAAAAVRLFRQHEARIRLLITDVMLPDRSGPHLIGTLQSMGGGFRTILTSGYPERLALKGRLNLPEFVYLAKPFSADALKHKVRQVLAQKDDGRRN